MDKRVILHIGASKCGSSAIQLFLANHREKLASRGVIIPGEKCDLESPCLGHQLWFFEYLRNLDSEEARDIITKRVARLHESIRGNSNPTVILSGENLCNPYGFEKIFAAIPATYDLQIVFYIRRQDDYLASAWQQWFLKASDSLDGWLEHDLGVRGNWADMLRPWEEIYGRRRITLRRFDRKFLEGGDVVEDFIKATGLEAQCSGLERPERLVNASLSEGLAELSHDGKFLFDGIHDNVPYEYFVKMLGAEALKKEAVSSLFSYEKRLKILDAYADCDRELKEKYFTSLDREDQIFPPPNKKKYTSLPAEERQRRKNSYLLGMVVNLHERVSKLEPGS